jgi:hypothetical protein
MSAFAAATNVLFADANVSASASYRAGGVGGVPVRVIVQRPDVMSDFNSGRFVSDVTLIDVRVSDCPDLAPGDRFMVNPATDPVLYEIVGAPVRDALRLVWKAEAREI